jgi:zinc D-Ala-D-Ala carboxypeptidase
MRRRKFLKGVAATVFSLSFSPVALAQSLPTSPVPPEDIRDGQIKDYLHKMQNFNIHHPDDIFLEKYNFKLLEASLQRLKRLQRTVGHGNFYLLSFDDALNIARNYTRVGRFTKTELNFLEKIFYEDGSMYGFFGEKPLKNLTDTIRKREVVKIPRSGNYIFKGAPFETYQSITKNIGDKVILTSGVRSVIKQFMLFLSKAYQSGGNLSMASRSLAPPGYSYHGIGDFDVGQKGYGVDNFTERFTTTKVFQKLQDHGYIDLRYQLNNLLGVRFEPWHIKVASKV